MTGHTINFSSQTLSSKLWDNNLANPREQGTPNFSSYLPSEKEIMHDNTLVMIKEQGNPKLFNQTIKDLQSDYWRWTKGQGKP